MLRDARDLDAGALLEADVCVVGAGAAGITLARDLRGSGLLVLLLEGGGLWPSAESMALYRGSSAGGIEYGDLTDSRLRFFGGTTNHWSGWCRPLNPEDFEARDWVPGSGWPFARELLDPWYRRAQVTCQLGAFDYDAGRIAGRLEMPTLDLDPARVETVVYQFSPPTRFGVTYREDVERAGDVDAWYHASAVEIVLDRDGARVAELACKTLDGSRSFRCRAASYVLAMGAIETPRLLLASNARRAEGVGNSSGQVGRGFMEHPHFIGTAWLLASGADLRFYGRNAVLTVDGDVEKPAHVQGALSMAPQLRRKEKLLNMICTFRPYRAASGKPPIPEQIARGQLARLLRRPGELSLWSLVARAEQSRHMDSHIRLESERDALGMPRVELSWNIAKSDYRTYGRGFRLIAAELARAG